MANRYWVGGTGNWSDNTNHWSDSSGGSPGASLPTSSDDVFIDSSSGFGGGGTITINPLDAEMNNFSSTSGHSYTIDGETEGQIFKIYGSGIFESGITFDSYSSPTFLATATGKTITTNSCDLYTITFSGDGGGWTLQDDLVASGLGVIQTAGTFDANDNDITAKSATLYASDGEINTSMGSGTWTITGEDNDGALGLLFSVLDAGSGITITPETSTIKFTDASVNDKSFYSDDRTFNNVWFTGSGTGDYYIFGSNTFNDFKVDTPPHELFFSDTSTTTVNTFTVNGTSGNVITINSFDLSSDGLTQHTLSVSSGTISCDYLNISNSNATGGADWFAGDNSTDTTNNDGWRFLSSPKWGFLL